MKRWLLLIVFACAPAFAAETPESEIPLNFEAKKGEATSEGSSGRMVLGLAMLALMAGGAWYLTRRGVRPSQRKNAPQIKILNQHWLGPKKSLAIIRVAGESILIGVTEQNISLIKPLSLLDDEVPEEAPQAFGALVDENEVNEPQQAAEGEEFLISGLGQIKDVVGRRLKNMRSLE